MDYRAIGLIESNSVAKGVQAADEMLKSASVELIMARPACPGKYLAMVAGEIGAVSSSVEAGKRVVEEFLVDTFTIANVHPDVFPALTGCTIIDRRGSVGIIETYSVAGAIVAADEAVKSADVDLIEVRCATGLAGKSYLTVTGDVGSVNAAIDAGVGSLADAGLVLAQVVIPNPAPELMGAIT